ncbi:hypothetical protein ACFQ3Y_09115 [Paenibacillus motobuensis]|uniref:hypothetical protein n=1 Tax=Paenibacillus motobuensis TaxID=295324 RepID=UPI00362E4B1F
MTRKSRFMKPLTSDIHFYTAQMDRTPIVVFVADELVGSGKIEDITENSVKISGERFLRESCTFKYAG